VEMCLSNCSINYNHRTSCYELLTTSYEGGTG